MRRTRHEEDLGLYYRCPKADSLRKYLSDGGTRKGWECNCGADEFNVKLDEALALLDELKDP